jgi:hypothetical protein
MAKKRASKKRSAKPERYPPTWTPNLPRRNPRRKPEWVGSRAGRKSKAPAYPLPPGCRPAHEVAAAAGGRVVVGNEAAKELRQAWWQDLDTGAWHNFSEHRLYDPHSFRQPGMDSIFRTGLWSRPRPMEGTRENPEWPKPTYEDVRVVLSTLASDPPELTKPYTKRKTKPKKKRAQKPREPIAPPPPPSHPPAPSPPAPAAPAGPNDKLPAAKSEPVTLKQDMILTLLDAKNPNGIPHRDWSRQANSIGGSVWTAECDRRGLGPTDPMRRAPPDRKTVRLTVKRWRS